MVIGVSPARPSLGQSSATGSLPQQESQSSGGMQACSESSGYTLFNPTPDQQMRPFSTDRPGKTHSPLTVDAGHFQEEGDIWNYLWTEGSIDDLKTRAYTLINPNLKLGLTNCSEFDIFLPTHNTLEVKGNGATLRAAGFGDILVGGKINFFGNNGGDQALGAIGFIKVPTAAAGLGNGYPEYTLNMPFSTTLPKDFSLTLEPAFGVLRNLSNTGYLRDYQFLINLNRPVIGKMVIAAIELALDFPGDGIGPRHTLDPSLQWLVTPNLQLDAGVYIGLTRAAPDWNPYVGISFRY